MRPRFEDEAIVVAFRKHTLLPLDDCLYALQATIPHLTRSSLHRCLQRHGIGRLPDVEGNKPARKKFRTYPIGYFHIDLAEVRTEQGKLYLFVAIDRTSKFAFVELHEKATRRVAGDFLRHLIAAVPYKIHTVLTDNGTHFTSPGNVCSAASDIKAALDAGETVWAHAFEYACAKADIDRRLEAEKIEAFDLGADDYVNKPFGVGELMARIRAALRHRSERGSDAPALRLGNLEIDHGNHRVIRAGQDVKLTRKEFDLLAFLARNVGKVVTHRQILAALWGPAHTEDTQYLRVYVRQLGQKIEVDPNDPKLILTEVGVGYRLADAPVR